MLIVKQSQAINTKLLFEKMFLNKFGSNSKAEIIVPHTFQIISILSFDLLLDIKLPT